MTSILFFGSQYFRPYSEDWGQQLGTVEVSVSAPVFLDAMMLMPHPGTHSLYLAAWSIEQYAVMFCCSKDISMDLSMGPILRCEGA